MFKISRVLYGAGDVTKMPLIPSRVQIRSG